MHYVNNEAPAVSTPSISSAAMLVELNISVWEGRKKDHRATGEVTAQKHAKTGVASVTKRLLGNCEELSAIQKYAASVRQQHRGMTLPWATNGSLNLLTNEMFPKYHEHMSGARTEFYRLVEDFLQVYQVEVGNAIAKLGDLFNADDYPTAESLRRKFKINFGYMPLPDTGDFRLDINSQAKDMLNEQWKTFHQEKLQRASSEVWMRLKGVLDTMSERLNYGDEDKPSRFRDTLVSNVEEIADLMKACNITKDPAMEQARIDLRKALTGITPDKLRASGTLRSKTKAEIDKIRDTANKIANLPSLDL